MRAVGIVLAGGNSNRLEELSNKRAVAAMPIAGGYRSIDFALSNMSNSHVQKVAVLPQYNARSLNEHLNSAKWWDFGRKQGGLFVFTPTITAENGNWYRGTADAIAQNLSFLKSSHEPYVVIASGDGVYKMDYNKMLEYHVAKKAVGLDMIAIPGDTKATTISGIIADEMAIGMVNQKTTAVRLIPVIGKSVGEIVEFGGLLGYAPIMPVNQFSSDDFINRGGRIPAPIHSFKN